MTEPEKHEDVVALVRAMFSKPGVLAEVARVLPNHLTPERMVRVALTAIQRQPMLKKCTALSLIGAIFEASQLGLEFDPVLGHAYLVPFRNKERGILQAVFIPGYRGLCELAYRSGEVRHIAPEIVFEADKFEIKMGTERFIHHEPLLKSDRGAPIGAYAVVVYKDGAKDFEFMTLAQIEKIKQGTKSKDEKGNVVGPWSTHWEEMARKTAIRRLAKRMPQSPAYRPFVTTAIRDEYRDQGVPVPVDLPESMRQDLLEAGVPPEPEARPKPMQPRRKSEAKAKAEAPATAAPKLIDNEQRAQIFNLARQVCGNNPDGITALVAQIIGAHGYEHTDQIPAKIFEAVLEDIRACARK